MKKSELFQPLKIDYNRNMPEKFNDPPNPEMGPGARFMEGYKRFEKRESASKVMKDAFDILADYVREGDMELAQKMVEMLGPEVVRIAEMVDSDAKESFQRVVERMELQKEIFMLRTLVARDLMHDDKKAEEYTRKVHEIEKDISQAAEAMMPEDKDVAE